MEAVRRRKSCHKCYADQGTKTASSFSGTRRSGTTPGSLPGAVADPNLDRPALRHSPQERRPHAPMGGHRLRARNRDGASGLFEKSKPRVIPMNSLIREALGRLPRKGEWVFTKPNGKPYTAVLGFDKARKAAGLIDIVPNTDSSRHGPYLTAYICDAINRERSRFTNGPGTRRVVEFKDARTLWARLPVQEGGGGRRSNPP